MAKITAAGGPSNQNAPGEPGYIEREEAPKRQSQKKEPEKAAPDEVTPPAEKQEIKAKGGITLAPLSGDGG